MKIRKVYGVRSTRVPPLYTDPIKNREAKQQVQQRESVERYPESWNPTTGKTELNEEVVKTEAMYPRMTQAGDFNSSRRATERIFTNGKDVPGRRVDQGSIERDAGAILPRQRNEADRYRGIRRLTGR